jgi:hypothetical protein
MSLRFKPPTRRELLFIVAAASLIVVPQFVRRATMPDIVGLLQLALLILFVSCLLLPLWFFYRIFLKGPLRARRINRIREQRLLREIMEGSENDDRESNDSMIQ